MARLPLLSSDDLSAKDRDVLQRPINLYRVLAHNPEAGKRISNLGSWLRGGGALDPRLRELAILQVGYLAGSAYEVSHHIKIGFDHGLSDEDVRAVVRETTGLASQLGEIERLVLRAAREVTSDLAMSDETWGSLSRHLSPSLLTELTVVISYYNMVVRLLATLDVDVEGPYQKYLAQFPLPATRPDLWPGSRTSRR